MEFYTKKFHGRLFNRAIGLTLLAGGFLLCLAVQQYQQLHAAKTTPPAAVPQCTPTEYTVGLEAIGLVAYGVQNLVLAVPMPSGPVKDQQRPPCDADLELEVAVNGGCWVILGKKPPCGRAYEYNHPKKGAMCLAPKKAAERPNTSGMRTE